ncbi:uncharacterized protein [Physcomitrium patens]|uniref:non-specific serine/threonine protein kinase n=1 Tax=Physcomitrium patens TaxID=3218 RepID=A0A7I4D7L9_PHYPA|nr:LRR receptor-like serine/threonine-protein kinase ERL1 isoform X2 [Physcomitrium patens]|eukprot:XP_024370975.1 LRR receptor-like serine/threonine-protein kinase ERL1 isoform X2 [Physcomitrella patens]
MWAPARDHRCRFRCFLCLVDVALLLISDMEVNRRLRWVVDIVTLLVWIVGAAAALTPDGVALLEFKESLAVSSQSSPLLKTWNESDASPCHWGGISCTRSGHVQSIDLEAQGLEGVISPSLGKLQSLQELILSTNKLSGIIPPDLGNCRSLVTLYLDGNALTGEIPEELANLENLSELALTENLLEGEIPPAFAALPNLTGFDLGENRLTGHVPPAIYENVNLVWFAVNDNNLTGDITAGLEALSKLPAIGDIWMHGNSFSGTLPPSIGNAFTLESICLNNQGYGISSFGGTIPREIGKLVNLTHLDLRDNNFTGTIPPELGNLVLLEGMFLSNNQLTGRIPREFGRLGNMVDLHLFQNRLDGPIPEELGDCHSLQVFLAYENFLNGSIPSSFGNLVNLTILDVHNNAMSGSLPVEIFNCTSLTSLYLADNTFSGIIPSEIGKLTSLTSLRMCFNNFSGPFPEEIANLKYLEEIVLNSNALTGHIPAGLSKLTELEHIFLYDNFMSGPLPSDLGRFSKLITLDIRNNSFNGSLPRWLCRGESLEFLDVHLNNFEGPIPSSLSSCRTLDRFRASDNRFTRIPNDFGRNCSLTFLDLSSNQLKGPLPRRLGSNSNLSSLALHDNGLTGDLSSLEFSQLPNLQSLDLSMNSLTAEIGSISTLTYLNLSYGGYTGPIPSELGKLNQLEVLDLSHNGLTGEVPNVLGDIVSLLSVNLSHNQLTGSLPSSWVKLFNANPSAFDNNPGLCLKYLNNQCVSAATVIPAGSGGKKLTVGVILGMIVGITSVLLLIVAFFFWRCWHSRKTIDPAPMEMIVEVLSSPGFAITFEDIMAATQNLNDSYIIGRGSHGVVYKATLASGTPIVAKKIVAFDKSTKLIHKSFWREIETIGHAKHRNLVRLLGFCKLGEVGLLLYDYVSNGDLHAALHNKELGLVLNWRSRLRIAEGVAHGLAYLHHDYDPPIVHRDIKASNVLLDDDLEAHISDFGIAKVLDMHQSDDGTTTASLVSGTYGYIAPEVACGVKVTPKLDVYSYGVLLLELLTGKQPADPSFGETMHIAAWVRTVVQQNEGRMSDSIIDPWILRSTNLAARLEMLHVQKIALLCTAESPMDRPAMRDVVEMLRNLPQTNEHMEHMEIG